MNDTADSFMYRRHVTHVTSARPVACISQQSTYLEAAASWLPREQQIAANDIYTYVYNP